MRHHPIDTIKFSLYRSSNIARRCIGNPFLDNADPKSRPHGGTSENLFRKVLRVTGNGCRSCKKGKEKSPAKRGNTSGHIQLA